MNTAELAAYKAGQIDQRLANMDEHFAVINGSIADSAAAQADLAKLVAVLVDRVQLAGRVALVFLAAWISAISYLILNH